MSAAANGDRQKLRGPLPPTAGRFGSGLTIIASTAMVAGIILAAAAAASPQMPSFHPTYPVRPPVAHTPSVTAAATKPASGPNKRKVMLTPEVLKRIADAKKRQAATRKAPAKKSKR